MAAIASTLSPRFAPFAANRAAMDGQLDAVRKLADRVLAGGGEAARQRLSVSYTHLTLPTSDLV